jgi:hypothetical protein
MTQLGDRHAPERIYVARTERAALGLYRQDGVPDRSLLCVLTDESPETDNAFADVVARHPGVAVQIALEAGEDERAAEVFEARVVATTHAAGAEKAAIRVRRSPPIAVSLTPSPGASADLISLELGRTRQRGERGGRDRGKGRISPVSPVPRSRGR